MARRREAKAQAEEQDGPLVTARENYFMAAIHWGAAQWPIDENDAQDRLCNGRKRECYTQYARLADHHVEAAWVPLPDGRALVDSVAPIGPTSHWRVRLAVATVGLAVLVVFLCVTAVAYRRRGSAGLSR